MGTGAAKKKPGRKITIVLVDDHKIFRQGIESNLKLHDDLEVVGHGANGEQALEVIKELTPDIAVMDVNLPLMNGIQVTRQLTNDKCESRVIILTAFDDPEQVLHAMRSGAKAYCAKEIEPTLLVEVIRHVNEGNFVVNRQVFDQQSLEQWMEKGVKAVAGQYYAGLADSYSPLSVREMEILQFVTQGMSNKEIANHLKISHQTVKNHMTAILRKLAVEDRTQAAVFALRRGWVRLRDTSDQDEN